MSATKIWVESQTYLTPYAWYEMEQVLDLKDDAMSVTTGTATPSLLDNAYHYPYHQRRRRRSSQIPPEEVIDLDSIKSPISSETLSRHTLPRTRLQRLRRSISKLSDLFMYISTYFRKLLSFYFKPSKGNPGNIPIDDMQMADAWQTRAKARRARKKLKRKERAALKRMKGWTWPESDESSMWSKSAISLESARSIEYMSDGIIEGDAADAGGKGGGHEDERGACRSETSP